jgi:hypothetical protein
MPSPEEKIAQIEEHDPDVCYSPAKLTTPTKE